MNRLEQLERLAAGAEERRDDPETVLLEARLRHQRERAKQETPNVKHAKALRKEQRLIAKAEAALAKDLARERSALMAKERPTLYVPVPEAERCTATTLVGHRCTLRAGHTEGHMGRMPDGVPLDPAAGITEWCRWERK